MRLISIFIRLFLVGAVGFAPATPGATVVAIPSGSEVAGSPDPALPKIDAAILPDINALQFNFSQPMAAVTTLSDGSNSTAPAGSYNIHGVYFINAYKATQASLAQISSLSDAELAGVDPAAKAAWINFDVLNGETPDPADDVTTVKEATHLDIAELRTRLQQQEEDILRETVKHMKREIDGPDIARHVDLSPKNICIMLVRVTGISGLSMFVGVKIAGVSLSKAIFSTALPAALSGWLMIANPGYMKWNQGKSINPFTASLGDFKPFQRSRLLKQFPLSLVKKVPLPFVDPNPGVPIPESEKVGAFSPRAMFRMFGFLVTYLSLAHVSTNAYESVWMQNPDFASMTSWYTAGDLVNIGVKSMFAFPAELLTARLIGDLADKHDLKVAKDYINGEIEKGVASAKIKRGMTAVLVSVCTMSVLTSVSQIRLAVSDNTLFSWDTTGVPMLNLMTDTFQFTDGHAAVLGMAAVLGGAYLTVVKSPWAIAKDWSLKLKRAYYRAQSTAKTDGLVQGLKEFFGYGPPRGGANPPGGNCPTSFIP